MDLNGDGIINQNDLRPFHDPAPNWILGHSSYLTYGNFDLGFTLRAYLGNYVYNNVASNLGTYAEVTRGSPYNLHTSVLKTGFANTAVPVGLLCGEGVLPADGQPDARLLVQPSGPAGAGLRHRAERVHHHRLQRCGSDRRR